jgi:hypothetical protein
MYKNFLSTISELVTIRFYNKSQEWWLRPPFLVFWEAKIRRIAV